MSTTLTRDVANYAVGTDFEKMPEAVAEQTKMIIFDELACAFVGRELSSGDLSARFVARQGGIPEATVLGTSFVVPASMAALANGTAGHADEIDGAHVTDGHPGAVSVHAAMAVCEMTRAPGRSLINAVALGYDIGCRVVEANGGAFVLRKTHNIHSDHLHSFGAAFACARVLGLDEARTRHAAALAAGHAGGMAVVFEERRHMSKALSNGQAAFAGTSGAILASMGFEGHDDVFDSQYGPLALRDGGKQDARFDTLGKDHAVMGANFKFYSAGYPIHAPVEAALTMLARHDLDPSGIARVEIITTSANADLVSNREMPSICVEDMISVAMVHGRLDFDIAHSSSAITDPRAKALRTLVEVSADPELDKIRPRSRGARVILTMQDGARHEHWVPHPKGHSQRETMTWSAIYSKWDEMLPRRIGDENYASYRRICTDLEAIDDISELAHLLRVI